MKNLQCLLSKILELKGSDLDIQNYKIPGVWINSENYIEQVNPIDFFQSQIENIIAKNNTEHTNKPLVDSLVYNLMPRFTTAYSHYDSEVNNTNVFKTSGTFLKTIALLPYLKSIGTDILYLLPVTSIGKHNKKGNLGSVYAVRNPYSLDDNLSEDVLGLDTELQFKALVEAAHLFGMKVISEFIFRTASVDSDLVFTHPQWFYWVKENAIAEYASPKFNEEELNTIKHQIEAKDFIKLPAPSIEFRNLFTDTPKKVYKEGDKYFGILDTGERCVIPGAFADWPPDDNQPIWSDVTYLKIFNNPIFNYIAYNTVRMYDADLNLTKYIQKDLVDHITNVVPYYIENFDIDGIMLDMGHALPEQVRKAIIHKSRKLKRDFIFFEENFIPNQQSKNEKFDAVVGYLPFDMHLKYKMSDYIQRVSISDLPILCFSTPENHNTPRLQSRFADEKFSQLIWALASFLPNSIRFIHSGFELLNSTPVNTGLGFTDEQINQFPSSELPLFSYSELNWDKSIIPFIRRINTLRNELIGTNSIDDFLVRIIEPYHNSVLTFILELNTKSILLCFNFNANPEEIELILPSEFKLFFNSITNVNFEVQNSKLGIRLAEFQFAIGLLK